MKKNQKDHLSKFDKRISKGYPSDREMPVIIILKRKAIRVYPDNQKVALYYSQALDRYISVPFGSKGEPLGMVMKEESQLDEMDFGYFRKPILLKSKGKFRPVARRYVKKTTAASNVQPKPEEEKKKPVQPGFETPESREALAAEIVPNKAAFAAGQLIGAPFGAGYKAIKHKLGFKESDNTMSKNNHLKESFTTNLRQIREKRLEEGWRDTATSMIPGVSAYKAAKEGRYLDAAGNLALDAVTVGTLGLGGATIKGGVAAAKALRAGKGASKALRLGKNVAKNSKGMKIARGIGRGAKAVAKGAVIGAAGIATALDGDRSSYAKRTKTPEFRGVNTPISNSADALAVFNRSIARDQQDAFTSPATSQGPVGNWSGPNQRQTRMYEQLQTLAKSKNAKPIQLKLLDENTVTINKGTAKKLLKTYNGLNEQNKKYMEKMLQESIVTFKQALTFATKNRT